MTDLIFRPGAVVQELDYVMATKLQDRTGWKKPAYLPHWKMPVDIDSHILRIESVAEHHFGVIHYARHIALALGLDELHCIRMAMEHDLPEAIVGDINYHRPDGTIDEELRRRKKILELKAIRTIYPDPRHESRALILEYMRQETDASHCVKEADVLEMVHQARAYENFLESKDALIEFWNDVARRVKSTPAQQLYLENLARSKMSEESKQRIGRLILN